MVGHLTAIFLHRIVFTRGLHQKCTRKACGHKAAPRVNITGLFHLPVSGKWLKEGDVTTARTAARNIPSEILECEVSRHIAVPANYLVHILFILNNVGILITFPSCNINCESDGIVEHRVANLLIFRYNLDVFAPTVG